MLDASAISELKRKVEGKPKPKPKPKPVIKKPSPKFTYLKREDVTLFEKIEQEVSTTRKLMSNWQSNTKSYMDSLTPE